MPRLEYIANELQKRRANGEPERTAAPMSTADLGQAAMLTALSRLMDINGISNAEIAKALADGLDALDKSTARTVKSIDPTRTLKAIDQRIEKLDKAAAALGKQLSSAQASIDTDRNGPVIEAIDNLRAAIQAVELPEPDLAPLTAAIESLKQSSDDATPAPAAPEEWVFEVEREEFSDRIKQVKATRSV